MARVLKGSHSFNCTPRIHPLTVWTIPVFSSRNWSSFTDPGGIEGRPPHQPFFFSQNWAKWLFGWYKNLDRSFFRFRKSTRLQTDRQTDGRTDGHGQTAFSWLDRPAFNAARS